MRDAARAARKTTSVGGMILVLAAAALLFAALRGGDDVATVWAVIAGCTGLVALLRYRDVLAWRASRGLETGRNRKLREVLGALSVAVLVVGLSDLAFLVGFFGTVTPFRIPMRAFVGPIGGRCYVGAPADVGWQATMGLILAALVARSSRRALWLPGATDWRRFGSYRKLWPIAVVLTVGLTMFGGERATRRAGWLELARLEAEPMRPGDMPSAARLEKARDYEELAARIWPPEPRP